MAWDVIQSESKTTGVKTTWVTLSSNEGAFCSISRGTVVGNLIVQVFASIDDGTTIPDVPLFTKVIDSADSEMGFPVSGPLKSIALAWTGAAGNATLHIRRNGGLVV